MKLSNKKLVNKLTELFNNINLEFIVLQKRHKYKNKFWRGYIYIVNYQLMNELQEQYVNDIIYPLMVENDYEHMFYINFENDYSLNDIMKHFPIVEEFKY